MFIVNYRGSVIDPFLSPFNPLRYPAPGLCRDRLVTWCRKQTKSRNVENSVTAHNYKKCDKPLSLVPVFNDLQPIVTMKSAIRIESHRFDSPDPCAETPPPLEKFPTLGHPHPLLPAINWSTIPKPLFTSRDTLLRSGSSGHGRPFPFPPLAGEGGSGGIFPAWGLRRPSRAHVFGRQGE